jgi:hypothetical protein
MPSRKLTPQEFAQSVKAKFPDSVASDGRKYTDISDEELTRKVIAKYPVYQTKVDTPSYFGRVQENQAEAAEDVGKGFGEAANNILGNFDELKKKNATAPSGIDKILNTLVFAGHIAGDIAEAAGKVALGSAKAAASPFTQIETPEGDTIGERFANPVAQKTKEIITSVQETHPELIDWVAKQVEANPEIAQGIGDLFKTLTLTGASKLAKAPLESPAAMAETLKTGVMDLVKGTTDTAKSAAGKVKDTAAAAKDTVKGAASKVKNTVKPAPADPLQATIEAVNPAYKGKALEGAYEQVVTKGRKIDPAGLINEQTLAPSEQAVKIGTRLSADIPVGETKVPAIKLSGKPIEDLDVLHKGLNDTEIEIEKLLKGSDPEIQYTADKQTMLDDLQNIKANSPLEYQAIKESGKVHSKVVEFAAKLIAKSDDTIKGLRDARIKFDAQARKEFPSAFAKDGTIDTKTPAGRAIKDVRDAINEHLYNSAPEGSELRTLIQRESDIFRASKAVSARAASGEGKNAYQLWRKANPTKARLLELGTAGVVGGTTAGVVLP